ncbi:hypothetical protein CI109_101298 [Kwoniella shandongensis]|uniref:Uncharacterized protein n=1 Tax=Kwoniella shandongensis TaxID=1734106 RepID=A0A5M6BU38_9TREE|nr:uncharacterized protein CI109_005325 [Kwoniella shandongensis]KAA5526368.1 hypothetical protein CI109_005325 [Kwoniella shandongensis]
MSSPFPSHPTSSPFSFPQLTHPSPLPNQGNTGPIFAPSPLSQLISSAIPSFSHPGTGSGQTPSALGGSGISPNYAFMAGAAGGGGITPNTSALIAAAAAAGGLTPGLGSGGQLGNPALGVVDGGAGAGVGGGGGGQDLIRGLQDAESMLVRLEHVLEEVKEVEGRVFDGAQEGDMTRIEGLHTECTQLLISLITLSQSHHFGALPTLPSSITTSDPTPSAAISEPANNLSPSAAPTLSELTRWAEERASLEFTRREGLKAGSKAVLDVLRAGATANR